MQEYKYFFHNILPYIVLVLFIVKSFVLYLKYLLKIRIIRIGVLQALEKWYEKELSDYDQLKTKEEDIIE